MLPYIADRFEEVEDAIAIAETAELEPQLSAFVAGYLTVKISGVYEDCVERIVVTKAEREGTVLLTNFIKNSASQIFRNPKYKNLKDFLSNFGTEVSNELDSKVNDENKFALSSIVVDKNKLAHGGSISVTIQDIKRYHDLAKVVILAVEDVLLED